MAITIRTGSNGSYKSAYVVWFVILPALKAGRVVVTNIEGMEPLDIIAERLEIEFPSSTKLIRITSRDEEGEVLWRNWFCWCPLNALIVIDECQDLFSTNVGFKISDYKYKPLDEFLPFLPDWYKGFFESRHVPVDKDTIQRAEIDDRGVAEYDENGRIIYPKSFNEGFQRHRKYNWDIELLSPDWKQINSAFKGPAKDCYFHKANDAFFWQKRKPFIYSHSKAASTITLPNGKDPNLITVHVPLEAHLLYKSTNTGKDTETGGMNFLLKNPRFWFVVIIFLCCVGYIIYALSSDSYFDTNEIETVPEEAEVSHSVPGSSSEASQKNSKGVDVLHNGGSGDSNTVDSVAQRFPLDSPPNFIGISNLRSLSLTATVIRADLQASPPVIELSFSMNAKLLDGSTYVLNEKYFDYLKVDYEYIDDCLVKISKGSSESLVTCASSIIEPSERPIVNSRQPKVSLL